MENTAPSAQPTPLEQFEKRLRAARWLAKQGFGIVLLPTPTPGDCGCPPGSSTRENGRCKSPGKHPLGKDWEHHAAHDRDEIDALTSAKPHLRPLRQFGVFPEPGSRLMVLDEDHPGYLEDLSQRESVAIPDTFGQWTSEDPVSGLRKKHLFMRLPDGVSEDEVPRKFGGGDIRIAGSGQVVGPWSSHHSGAIYEPFGPAEVATAPVELIEALKRDAKRVTVEQDRAETPADEGWTLEKGARWPFLVRRAVLLRKGGLRNPDLERVVQEINRTRCSPPHVESEIARLCADVNEYGEATPGFTLNVPGTPGHDAPDEARPALRVVRKEEFEYEVDPPKVGAFPEPPSREVMGSTGAAMMTGELTRATTGSEVGILASFLTMWGGLVGAHFDLYEPQPTNLFTVMVGETASGRKGTTTRAVWNALTEVFAPQNGNAGLDLEGYRWDGLASGQGFLRQMKDAPVRKGVAIEEEFENVLRGARSSQNYTSTLGTTIQKAFDGGMLQHVTVRGAIKVPSGYTVGILGNITRAVLRQTLPPEFTAGGFGNRFLWLPVQERPEAVARGGNISVATTSYLRECRRYAEKHPVLTLDHAARDLVQDYYRYLQSLTGIQSQMSRRLHVIAARIGAVHARLDQTDVIEEAHVMAGIALAEYSRRGMVWTFTDKTGDEWLDVVVEAVRAAGPQGLPTRPIARMLQNVAPRIEKVKTLGVEAGLFTIERVSSGSGRPISMWKCAQNDPISEFVRSPRARGGVAAPPSAPLSSVQTGGGTDESAPEIEQTPNKPLTTNEQPPSNTRMNHSLKCHFYREHTSIHALGRCGAFHCSTCSPEDEGCPEPDPVEPPALFDIDEDPSDGEA